MSINKAIISEKSFSLTSKSKYSFVVSKDMSKESIKHEIEKIYAVKVIDVNTFNLIGKVKRGKKGFGKRSDTKKAIVTLSPKDSINLFDVEGDKKPSSAKATDGKDGKGTKKEIAENKEVKTVIREPKKGLLGRTTNK
jgi:large subunit ribosomal protein L23